MDHVLIAAVGPSEWVRELGKSSSETSFSVYVGKKDDRIVTLAYPSKYPDKIWSLLFSIELGNEIYLYVDKMDRTMGEIIITLDLLNKVNGNVFVHPDVDRQLFEAMVKGTVVEKYDKFDGETSSLRERLFEIPPVEPKGEPMVVLDQAFNVKGVGTVVLGFVKEGQIGKHQEMFAYPGGKRSTIRSIQIHDKDHNEAPTGARVGLAMKNIDPDDLPRGSILSSSNDDLMVGDELEVLVRISDHWKEPLSAGMRFHLSLSLQF
ncbi:MAG: hypothetical protein KAH57_07355, partial [Thermoplasmata archaeon]|nr:hypothetical protein [Thermoplasmata archaeon]